MGKAGPRRRIRPTLPQVATPPSTRRMQFYAVSCNVIQSFDSFRERMAFFRWSIWFLRKEQNNLDVIT